MLGRTNTGGGGGVGGLNFQVIGSTTAPGNPKENMIWVNTDNEITSWIFSATQPTNPTEGMVWISTGTASAGAFNALKKNGIQVYPVFARQYIAGAWVNKTAKTYKGGAFADWFVYLLDGANTYDEVTGGWVVRNHNTAGYPNMGSVTFDANGAKLVNPNKTAISIMTANRIDLRNFKKITVVVTDAKFTVTTQRLLFGDNPISDDDGTSNAVARFQLSQGRNVFEIPEGLKSGEYYVSIGMFVYDQGDQYMTVKEIFFE